MSESRKWDDVIKSALEIYMNRDKYAYFYGAKGEVLTDEVMDTLIKEEPQHFSKYSKGQLLVYKDFARGKIGYDCSGFVGLLVGDNTYSGALWEHCVNKKDDVFQGKAGCILWKPGHVAIDIGYGYSLEFPTEGQTCKLARHKERPTYWSGCGEHRNVDYTGASER